MSTLTKVFTVLLVVFSIAFTTMTVSMATQTANWREVAQTFEANAKVADTNLRNLIAANAAELAAVEDKINTYRRAIDGLESKLEEARASLTQSQIEVRRLTSEKSGVEAMNRGLLAQLQASEKNREAYRTQRDTLETQAIDLQRRNIDLSDRVNELTANVTVLVEQKRQFEQQINLLRQENDKLARRSGSPSMGGTMEEIPGAGMRNVNPVTANIPSAIRGRIIDVKGDIVTISVGSADGVHKDMVFVIHRKTEYVGDLKVSLVDPNQAAGRLTKSRLVPSAGDQVTDELGLAGSRG